MATVRIAEAGNRLSDLIDRALSGKQIFITRDGRPVIAVKPVPQGRARCPPPTLIGSPSSAAKGRSRPRTPAPRSAACATKGDFASIGGSGNKLNEIFNRPAT